MARRQDALQSLLEPVVTGLGYELWGLEYLAAGSNPTLRIYIDAPEGITLDDCERVSRHLGGLLEVEDALPGEHTLEVSSPGLDRRLFKADHYARYAGRQVKLTLGRPLPGRRGRKLNGTLAGLESDGVALQVDGEAVLVPLELIERARLVPEL